MPLTIPVNLPAVDLLKQENIFVMDSQRASSQDIRPLKLVILNLMPLKITTETDLIRLLSNSPLQIEIDFMKISGHVSKNTPIEHMEAFYKEFSLIKKDNY
ncbi:MAG: homoserine O-succinyltransferase, partial [Bacteroidales bacterium]|nr:homoserine O-succinyltransferase [Bacteroidales bacterium]